MSSPFASPLLFASSSNNLPVNTLAQGKLFSRLGNGGLDSNISDYDPLIASTNGTTVYISTGATAPFSGTTTLVRPASAFGAGTPASTSFGGPLRKANIAGDISRSGTTFTLSLWLKRAGLTTTCSPIFSTWDYYLGSSLVYLSEFRLWFNSTGQIMVDHYRPNPGTNTARIRKYYQTTAVFRDPSAWYHIVFILDLTNPNMNDRMRLYVNGVRITTWTLEDPYGNQADDNTLGTSITYVQNRHHWFGNTLGEDATTSTTQRAINSYATGPGFTRFDGIMSEIYFINNQTLEPSNFGQTLTNLYNMWVPKQFTPAGGFSEGRYYLDFKNYSNNIPYNQVTWIGKGENFYGGNIQDQTNDVPGFGGPNRSNYCTILGSDILYGSGTDTPQSYMGNTRIKPATTQSTGQWGTCLGTTALESGKWYFETKWTAANTTAAEQAIFSRHIIIGCCLVGQMNDSIYSTNYLGAFNTTWGFQFARQDYPTGGEPYIWWNGGTGGTNTIPFNLPANLRSIAVGDVIGCAIDVDAGKIWYSKNGTWLNGNPVTGQVLGPGGITSGPAVDAASNLAVQQPGKGVIPGVSLFLNTVAQRNNAIDVNFGQKPFTSLTPIGFKPVCTANMADPIYKTDECFQIVTRSGTGQYPLFTTTGTLIDGLPSWTVGTAPYKLACTSNGRFIYNTNTNSNNISIRDLLLQTTTTISTDIGVFPTGIAVSPDNQFLYVASWTNQDIRKYSLASLTAPSLVATYSLNVFGVATTNPWDITIDSTGTFIYAVGENSNHLHIINTTSGAQTVVNLANNPNPATNTNFRGIAITPDNTRVYITSLGSNRLIEYIVATGTVTSFDIGLNSPRGLSISKDGTYVYVACSTANIGNIVQYRIGTTAPPVTKVLGLNNQSSGKDALASVAVTEGGDYILTGKTNSGANNGNVAIYDLSQAGTDTLTGIFPIQNGTSGTGSFIPSILILPYQVNEALGLSNKRTFAVYAGNTQNTIWTVAINSYVDTKFAPNLVWTKARNANVLGTATGWNFAYLGSFYNNVNGGLNGTNVSSGIAVHTGRSDIENIAMLRDKDTEVYFNNTEKKYFLRNTTTADAPAGYENLANAGFGRNYVDYIFGPKIMNTRVFRGTETIQDFNHNLGFKPGVIIAKAFRSGGVYDYQTYLQARRYSGALNQPNIVYKINTSGTSTNANFFDTGDTYQTTTTLRIGTSNEINILNDFCMYACLAQIPGISKSDIFNGNGSSNGAFLWTGFKPAFLLVKRQNTATTGYNLIVMDTARKPYNLNNLSFSTDSTNDDGTGNLADFYANGIKFRDGGGNINPNTWVYYIAIAEAPFKYSLAR